MQVKYWKSTWSRACLGHQFVTAPATADLTSVLRTWAVPARGFQGTSHLWNHHQLRVRCCPAHPQPATAGFASSAQPRPLPAHPGGGGAGTVAPACSGSTPTPTLSSAPQGQRCSVTEHRAPARAEPAGQERTNTAVPAPKPPSAQPPFAWLSSPGHRCTGGPTQEQDASRLCLQPQLLPTC